MISMGHICIVVKNIEETIDWYKNNFGFEVSEMYNLKTKKLAFLRLPNVEVNQIELLEDQTLLAKDFTDSPIQHFCLEIKNFNLLYEELKMKNINFLSLKPQQTGRKNSTIYLNGINGECIQLLEVKNI